MSIGGPATSAIRTLMNPRSISGQRETCAANSIRKGNTVGEFRQRGVRNHVERARILSSCCIKSIYFIDWLVHCYGMSKSRVITVQIEFEMRVDCVVSRVRSHKAGGWVVGCFSSRDSLHVARRSETSYTTTQPCSE